MSSASFLDAALEAELQQLRERQLHRLRRVVEGRHGVTLDVDGRRCVNFCSNDYLGLAADPRIAEAARSAFDDLGTGSGAAALVSGYNAEHAALEEELADFVRRPRALLFSSGWAANLGVMKALLGKRDTLIADELNHASLIDGGRLSHAAYVRVPHRDAGQYARALQSVQGQGRILVATDAVFSMDGDLAPLTELAALCRARPAALLVDDAHGFGVLGTDGRGTLFTPGEQPDLLEGGTYRLPPSLSVPPAGRGYFATAEVPIYVATLGKALGVSGGFVAGSATLIDYLVQRARSWVFSTAPPPALAAAARRALGILQAEPERRQRLFALTQRFREGAWQLGLPIAESVTPIQPVMLGSEARALALSRFLFERGFWVAAIRPPTVPPGTARLRITFSAVHTEVQVDRLLEALAEGLRLTRDERAA